MSLRNRARRPDVLRDPIPEDIMNMAPHEFELDEMLFLRTLRSSRKGAAGGPSDDERALCERQSFVVLCRGATCQGQRSSYSCLHDSAREDDSTPEGHWRRQGHRGRRCSETSGGTDNGSTDVRDCTSCHALTEADPEATILSIDGISAFDLTSRSAMLRGLVSVAGVPEAILFVRMFYGQPSLYIWEDDEGTVHEIHQAEGGEQGDALMPLLFALGQHSVLASVQEGLAPGDLLFAFLDDVYVKTLPARVGAVDASVEGELFRHAGIRVHGGKTCVWNSARIRPPACDILEQIAQAHQQGIKVLGTPLGHADFVRAHLDRKVEEHQELLRRIPTVPDLQSAWLLLLHCAAAKATYLLRVLPFAAAHYEGLWQCFLQVARHLAGPASRHTDHDHSASCSGRVGVEKRAQNKSSCLLGQLGGLPPDDSGETTRICSTSCAES